MTAQPQHQHHYYTVEEYLALEREAAFKSEYFQGEIYAMAGGRPMHGAIAMNLAREFVHQLKGKPCWVFSSDVMIRTNPNGLFSYPDLSIACEELTFHDSKEDIITNPILIVEVVSDSTEAYDRGKKFRLYQQIETFTDYLLVAQDEPHIDHYEKQADGRWLLTSAIGLGANLPIPSLGCTLSLAEVYDKIVFPVSVLTPKEAK